MLYCLVPVAATFLASPSLLSPSHEFARTAPAVTLRSRAVLAAAAAPDRVAGLFGELIASDGVRSCVEIASSKRSRGQCLVASRDVDRGEALLVVPKSLLVTAHRAGNVNGLVGQTDATWDAAGDLREEVGEELFKRGATWDVRLAVGVFDACGGAGGPFWDAYRRLLPPPPRLAHPMTLPAAWLPEVQDAALEAKVKAKAALLRDLYPALHTHSAHPATAGYEAMGAPMDVIPQPLPYAYALVVSRCFAMADGDTFAFVPFLDLCDHAPAEKAMANFASDARGFVLRALRPIASGEEVG